MPDDNQLNSDKQTTEQPIAPSEPVSFPWLMVVLAAAFDLIGVIPIINLFTELLAGLIIGLWQKGYAPKTDPLISFFVAKVIDIFSLGILPSNIAVVVYAYLQKKAQDMKEKLTPLANSRLGKFAISNIDSRYQS